MFFTPISGMKIKILMWICLMAVLPCGVHAQHPVIFSVDKAHAAPGETITLQGSDFGTDPAQVSVLFGGVAGQITAITNQLITATVPTGAMFGPIRVVNTTTGRAAAAPVQFFPNFGGEGGITTGTFAPQVDFQARTGLYDLCLCDFDNDGKPDIATASSNDNLITIFRNISTPGNVNFAGQDVLINARTLHVKCGDLNGDGRQDIVLTEASDGARVFVLKNNGGFSFTQETITIPGIKVKQVHLADLDLDGRNDIVVTNAGGNVLTILPNTSTLATMSFGTPVSATIPGAESTDALEIADLDNDGYPDIATSQYQADSDNKLYILRNGGAFDFTDVRVITVNKAISSIRVADLDADGKRDIVIARLTGSDVSVYRGKTPATLEFEEPVSFITETRPVGMDFGDLDGDGKLDLTVGAIAQSVSILNNTSPGTVFAPVVKRAATYINRNLRNADVDGDGKPDIVFTSVDDFSGVPVPASKVSVIRNLSCLVPRVTPEGPMTPCTGSTVQLTATAVGGVTYEWFREGDASALKSGTDNFLEVTTSGYYKVVATSTNPVCAKESATVEITFAAPSASLTPGDANARSNSPVCTGNTLQLQVNDMGATGYRWLGPDGFEQTVATTTLDRDGFDPSQAGLYIVEMLAGTCVAKTDSTLVESITVPEFTLQYDGVDTFCSDANKTLTVTPFLSTGFTYQWHEKSGGPIPEADFETLVVTGAGEYFVVVTPDQSGCQPKQTGAVTLVTVAPPTTDFNAPLSACVGEVINFTQTSQGTPGMDLVYSWVFGDGEISGDANPSHAFQAPDTYEVNLKVFYPGLPTCLASATHPVEISGATPPQIIASAAAMCEGETVSLSISGTFENIAWSTGETGAGIEVHAPGIYEVTTLDDQGCEAVTALEIRQKPLPAITVSADRQVVAAGQPVQLQATGADAYVWSPGKTLNDSTLASPLASPTLTTTYVVTGSLADGCPATASITIQVSGEIVNIHVPVLFSPNGDDTNEILIIGGVENYPDCSLSVFDRRGARVYGTTGYQNNWDGTYNGTPLPEGVYYFVFACPDSKAVTGTVTIIR